jgi:hypothetical protein
MRRRVFRLYGELKFIELELESKARCAPENLLARLNRLEERANHLRLPTGFANLHYTLREHIDLVKMRLQSRHRGNWPGDSHLTPAVAKREAG